LIELRNSVYIRIHTQIFVNKIKNHISIVSALVVAFGITISSIHIHIDDHLFAETGQSISQDELHCFICGSVFKFNPDSENAVDSAPQSETYFYVVSNGKESSSFVPSNNGRAPPA